MTVQTQVKKATGLGNDSAFVFSFSPMVIYASSDLTVTHVDASGVETLLTEGTGASNYSVTVATYPGTGSITYPADEGTPMPTGESVVMKPVFTIEQQTSLSTQGGYNPKTLETQLDKGIRIDLQQQEELDRAMQLPVSATGISLELPTPVALEFFRWNAAADAVENIDPGSAALQIPADGSVTIAKTTGMQCVIQVVSSSTNAYSSTSSVIWLDDTIPYKTEGVELLTVAITPTEVGNLIIVEADLVVSSDINRFCVAALFIDSVGDAVAASAVGTTIADYFHNQRVRYEYTSVGTSEVTFKLRVGINAGTLYINGDSTGRRYGGTLTSFLTATEYHQ